MSIPLKDVLLVGLRAVGSIYALVLQRSGVARVSVVARSNYEAVKADGMHIKSKKYGDHKEWRPYRLFPSVEEAVDRVYTHIVLTTKVILELQCNSELLAPFLSSPYAEEHPQPTYVLMQNGINIEVDLYNAIKALNKGEPKIIGSSLWLGTKMTGKNVVEHNYFDRVSIGIHRSEPNIHTNSPSEAATLAEFSDMLSGGGTEVTTVPEIHRVKYVKNALNCWANTVTALTRISYQGIFRKPQDGDAPIPFTTVEDRTPSQIATASISASFPAVADYTIPWLYDVLDEVTKLGQILYPPSPDSPDKPGIDPQLRVESLHTLSDIGNKPGSNEKPSMLIDVEMGRPTELEVLIGEVVRAGREVGANIPRLETLYALMLILQSHLLHEYRRQRRAV